MDYSRDVQQLRQQHTQNLYEEEGKNLRIEYRFWHPFHFDFYDHLVYRCFLCSKKGEPLVLDMQYIDTYSLGQMLELELKQLVHDLRRMGLERLMEFCKPWNNEIIC